MSDQINIKSPELIEFRQGLGLKLAEIRRQRGKTIEDVAEAMEVKKSTVASIEDGRWAFNIDMLYKFKQVLDFDLVFEI